MKIFLLNILRRLSKSFSKCECLIQDLIFFEKFKKKFGEEINTNKNIYLENAKIDYKKIKEIITIPFLYKKKFLI
jgi:hypothetical protein